MDNGADETRSAIAPIKQSSIAKMKMLLHINSPYESAVQDYEELRIAALQSARLGEILINKLVNLRWVNNTRPPTSRTRAMLIQPILMKAETTELYCKTRSDTQRENVFK